MSARWVRTLARRDLRAHKVRLGLTIVSVLLGTAFVAGSFVFTDSLRSSFDDIFDKGDAAVDARVSPRNDYQGGVPTSTLAQVRRVPGVAKVQPQIYAPVVVVDSDGKKVVSDGAPTQGGVWTSAKDTLGTPPTLAHGHAPRRAGEVVINQGASDTYHLSYGEHVKVVVPNAADPRDSVTTATIVGIYRTEADTGGYLGALFARDQAMSLFTDGHSVSAIDVAAASGVSEKELARRIDQALPASLKVRTGDQVRADNKSDIETALSFITYILLGFGIVALLVGTFIIYNTFAMLVAQRQRELALLRAIGADRRQLARMVRFEALLIGLVGSVLGVLGGVGLAYGLHALLDSMDLGLPDGGLVVSPRTVLVSVVLGCVVTAMAASAPARRASRIPPVAAMRADATTPTATSLRRRTALGLLVGLAGGAAAVAGVATDDAGSAAGLVGLGLIGVCAASMLLTPVLARWIIDPLGRVIGRPFGVVGRLARTNAVRNPRRTGATAFALTLGLVLVSGIAVVGSSAKASIGKVFANDVRADYILTTDAGVQVPAAAARAASRVDGVRSTTQLHELAASVDGRNRSGTAVDGPLTAVLDVRTIAGSLDTSGRKMIVSETVAKERGWTVGTRHTLRVPGRAAVTLTVAGVYADSDLVGPWAAGGDVYRALTPRERWSDQVALIRAEPGTDLAALRSGLEKATAGYYVVDVRNRTEFKGFVAGQIDGLIGLLYALLALAIVIAILGIVNTQALSVVERRRELGMLRAVGMQRKQVRRTVYLESLLIAVLGATVGLAVGVTFGALFTHTLAGEGLDVLSIPWAQTVTFLVVSAGVGVLAALWPGFRAARTPPLQAVSTA